eukprot:364603-Chlamydomonas_euryale.AAC.2
MRDTAQLGALSSFLANGLIPTDARARLFRTWGSLMAMMPTGGTKVWEAACGEGASRRQLCAVKWCPRQSMIQRVSTP